MNDEVLVLFFSNYFVTFHLSGRAPGVYTSFLAPNWSIIITAGWVADRHIDPSIIHSAVCGCRRCTFLTSAHLRELLVGWEMTQNPFLLFVSFLSSLCLFFIFVQRIIGSKWEMRGQDKNVLILNKHYLKSTSHLHYVESNDTHPQKFFQTFPKHRLPCTQLSFVYEFTENILNETNLRAER